MIRSGSIGLCDIRKRASVKTIWFEGIMMLYIRGSPCTLCSYFTLPTSSVDPHLCRHRLSMYRVFTGWLFHEAACSLCSSAGTHIRYLVSLTEKSSHERLARLSFCPSRMSATILLFFGACFERNNRLTRAPLAELGCRTTSTPGTLRSTFASSPGSSWQGG